MTQTRNYGIDLLRAVSMYMILLLHLVNHGGAIDNTDFLSGQYCVSWGISILCYCAVNCFAAISGYVGVDSEYKWRRIFSLWFTVFFYSMGVTLAFFLKSHEYVSTRQWLSAFAPIVTNQYWYMTAYFGLFLIMPILNSALNNLSREALVNMLVAVIIFMCLIPNLTHCTKSSLGLMNGYSMVWLAIMYFIGGTVKKLGIGSKLKTSVLITLFTLSCVFVFCTKISIDGLALKITGEVRGGNTFLDYTSPFILLNAVLMLSLFSRIKIQSTKLVKWVGRISSTALGVYLIHVHPLIWDNVLYKSTGSLAHVHPLLMTIIFLMASVGIYAACHIVDYLRMLLFKVMSISTICNKLEQLWIKMISKCHSIIN